MTQGNSVYMHSEKHYAIRHGNPARDSPPLLVALLYPAPGLRIFIHLSSLDEVSGLEEVNQLGLTRSSDLCG